MDNAMSLAKLLAVRSFNRYLLVGASNTAVALLSFPALYWIASGIVSLNVILFASAVISTLFAFATHRLLTFQSRGRIWLEIVKFFALQGGIYLVNVVLFNALVSATTIHPVLIQIAFVLAVLAINYAVLNAYVFPEKVKSEAAGSS